MTKPKMRCAVSGGINWTWFKVQNGNLVAVFRLHHGEDRLQAFRKLEKDMTRVEDIEEVPWATWREPCDLIANHNKRNDGYALPEVAEAFGWLNDMFKETASDFERKFCAEAGTPMRHLEYHGVAICRIK